MAKTTTKPAVKPATKTVAKAQTNTSAPAKPAGNPADVTAAEGVQTLSATETQPPVNSSENKDSPLQGAQANKQASPTHLVVKAQREGFARAGRRWSAEETTVAIDEFSPEQIEALEGEPMLTVVFVVL